MKRKLLLACITAGVFLNAQSAGEMISYEKKPDLTPSFLAQHFVGELAGQQQLGSVLGGLISIIDQSHYKLEAYKVVYWTPNYEGKLVKASGLVMFPKVDYKLSTIVYCHGTTTKKDVPSNLSDSGKLGFILPTIFAVNEYIVVAPDFIGLGDSEGYHPYMNAKTEATATLDMTKASNQLLQQLGTKRYDEYFLTGYSQGAHAAMAALKSNNLIYKNFDFKYVSVGGGPYDMSDTTLNIGLLQKPEYSINILANIINGCQTIGYKSYNNSYKEIIAPAYQEAYQKNILDNPDELSLDWGPLTWRDMFYPSFVNAFENDQNHPLRKCLEESDVYDWYNTTPIYMTNNKVDNLIPYQNTDKTKAVMRSKFQYNFIKAHLTINGTVFNMDYGLKNIVNHVMGAVPYTIASSLIFAGLRQGGFTNSSAKKEMAFSKKLNDKQELSYDFNGSPLDSKLNILGATNFKVKFDGEEQDVEKTSSADRENQEIDLKALNEGPHFIEVTTNENKKMTIPYVKIAPEEIPSSSFIREPNSNEIILDLHDVAGFKKINLFNEQKQLVNSFESSQIKNGELIINTQKLTPQTYTFELVISPISSLTAKYKKTMSNLLNDTHLTIVSVDSIIKIKANKNLQEVKVHDMSGRLIWNADHINSTEISSPSISSKGVYNITAVYTDGTIENKKILQK